MNKKDRDISIDLAKGIAMLLVIWGHYGWKGAFNTWIYAFHMPFFMFISGYLRGGKENKLGDYGSFLKKRARRLAVPYIAYSLINLCIYTGIKGSGELKSSLASIFFWVTTDDFPIAGALWFLIALFWIEIIYTFLAEYRNVAVRLLLCVLFPVISLLIPSECPYAIRQAFVLYPFYYVGVEMRTTNVFEGIRNRIGDLRTGFFTALIFVGGGILAIINGKVNYRDVVLNNTIIAYLAALCLCCSCLYVCRVISRYYAKTKPSRMIVCSISFVGINSLHYLGLHQFFGDVFYKVLLGRISNSVNNIITFLAIIICCSLYVHSFIAANKFAKIGYHKFRKYTVSDPGKKA